MTVSRSIFNDVLGPIMAGPSSSHSAGCARIGKMTHNLYGKNIEKAVVTFDENGSYPSTYIGQGSNFGFTGGLMGYSTDDIRIKDSVQIARNEGKHITFSQARLSGRHPNEAKIDIYDDRNEIALSVLTLSTGGGAFEIVELDGFPVSIDGSMGQIYVSCDSNTLSTIESDLKNIPCQISISFYNIGTLMCIQGFSPCDKDIILQRCQKHKVKYIKSADAILPVSIKANPNPLFTTAKQALEYTDKTGKSAYEIALDYECSIGDTTPEKIFKIASCLYEVMEKSMIAPDAEKTPKFGFLDYKCNAMAENIKTVNTVEVGVLTQAMLAAIAVMENNCAHNIIVASPTAGSSGVIPAAIISVGKQMKMDKGEIIKGLIVSGLAGSFIANQATFGAEVGACQAENGAASAMAAAGLVQLLGGTTEQCFMAGSLALQNMLGLICDPVGGLTEIPCISRNISALSNAILSANMIMCSFDPVIPFDETILSMHKIGKMLPSEFKCTCKGGLCDTPTGRNIAQNIAKKREIL